MYRSFVIKWHIVKLISFDIKTSIEIKTNYSEKIMKLYFFFMVNNFADCLAIPRGIERLVLSAGRPGAIINLHTATSQPAINYFFNIK